MPDAPLRYLIVGNPTSRSGKGLDRIDAALAILRRRAIPASFLPTRPAGGTVPDVAEAIDQDRCDVVVSVGGDGTFAEVAKGVLAARRRVPMGFLPSGTANDQGRSFGLSTADEDLEDNLDVVLKGFLCQMDVGRIERFDDQGRVTHADLFFDSAGFGLQPDILSTRNRDRSFIAQIPILRDLYRDQAVYAGATFQEVLRTIVEPVKFDAEVTTRAGTFNIPGLTDLIINATPVYGGWWVPTPETLPDDGKMELVGIAGRRDMLVTSFRNITDLQVPIPDLDVLGAPVVRTISSDSFDLLLLRPRGEGAITSQIDGEEWVPGTHFRVTVLANALPLVVREGFVPPWRASAAAP